MQTIANRQDTREFQAPSVQQVTEGGRLPLTRWLEGEGDTDRGTIARWRAAMTGPFSERGWCPHFGRRLKHYGTAYTYRCYAAFMSSHVAAATQPLPLPTYDASKVANPSATASAGSTAMSSAPASFAVSPSGAATYSISLQVMPGLAGFRPGFSIE